MKWRDFKHQMERQYWEEMLTAHGTVTAAAAAADVNRTWLHNKLRRVGVRGMYQRKGQGGNQAWRSIGH